MAKDKQRQQRDDAALQDRMSARFESAVKVEIARQIKAAAAAYERGDKPKLAGDGMRRIIESNVRTTATYFGKRLLNEVKSAHGPDVIKASLIERLGIAVGAFIKKTMAKKVVQINRTTEAQIRTTIRRGLSDGLGVDKIARELRKTAGPLSALRAHVIARTETHTAANFGAQAAAELTGLDMKREWVSASDERTRDPHSSADGQTRGMNEAFEVNGEALMYPGDPSGSAGNIINCRCQVVFLYD